MNAALRALPGSEPQTRLSATVIGASRAEADVLAMLRHPHIIAASSPHVAALLGALRPHWRRMTRADRTAWVRRLLWTAEWKPKSKRLALMFDEIGIEQLLEDEPLQVVDGLPVIPERGPGTRRKKPQRS